MTERKQINFTIVPDESSDAPRTYANFCAISHTPFDFTLTFCEVLPHRRRRFVTPRLGASSRHLCGRGSSCRCSSCRI